MRSPATISTSSPAASAGCTTTSGASTSATTCSGNPRIDMPVPRSQRPRRTSRHASARRRCVSSGASLASIAWNATPRLYSVEAPMAATIPRTSSPMSNDHRSRGAWIAGATAAAAYGAYALPALAAAWPPLRRPLGVESTTRSGRGYALTFDDGPHAQGTPAVLEVLARERVGATFFLVGEQVRRNPSLPREILAAGHAVALHCDRHRNLLRLAPSQVREDIARAEDTIAAATGVAPTLYRPPYGVLNASALSLARRRGWRTLLWSHWGRDWEQAATPESIAALLTDGAGPGSVLLAHDADDYSAPGSWRQTVAALPAVIETMRARGIESELP